MKTFLIAGSIVDADADKETFEDVTPAQVNAFLKTLSEGEGAELDITSYGGSVTAGLAICNLLKKASAEGHRTTARVIGIAASMASAIACACDELRIDSNAFLMVHNPWTLAMGNAGELRKEAEVLDQYRDALLAVYRTKFAVSDGVLVKMLDDETWIMGEAAPMFNLDCEVVPTAGPLRAAAFAKAMPKFLRVPKALRDLTTRADMDMKDENAEEKTAEQMVQEAIQDVEEAEEAKATEQPQEQPQEQAPEQPAEEAVPKAEVEKRVSGMQSAMARQMDAMKKDYEARIADFEVQMKAKDEELTKAKAEVTSLAGRLDRSERELSEMTSAFEEKKTALDALNAGVNTPRETTAEDWKTLRGQAFFDWVKAHPECLKTR